MCPKSKVVFSFHYKLYEWCNLQVPIMKLSSFSIIIPIANRIIFIYIFRLFILFKVSCFECVFLFQMMQHALITNPDTFLTDPEKKYEKQYEAWLEIIEDQLTADRLSKMMAANPELHLQYTTLVPDKVINHL